MVRLAQRVWAVNCPMWCFITDFSGFGRRSFSFTLPLFLPVAFFVRSWLILGLDVLVFPYFGISRGLDKNSPCLSYFRALAWGQTMSIYVSESLVPVEERVDIGAPLAWSPQYYHCGGGYYFRLEHFRVLFYDTLPRQVARLRLSGSLSREEAHAAVRSHLISIGKPVDVSTFAAAAARVHIHGDRFVERRRRRRASRTIAALPVDGGSGEEPSGAGSETWNPSARLPSSDSDTD